MQVPGSSKASDHHTGRRIHSSNQILCQLKRDHASAWVRPINFSMSFFEDQYKPETILGGAKNHRNSHFK